MGQFIACIEQFMLFTITLPMLKRHLKRKYLTLSISWSSRTERGVVAIGHGKLNHKVCVDIVNDVMTVE